MHHILKPVYLAAWVITALVAINFGLAAFGYDFFNSAVFVENASNLLNPIRYIVLIAGILSLVKLVLPHDCGGNCKC